MFLDLLLSNAPYLIAFIHSLSCRPLMCLKDSAAASTLEKKSDYDFLACLHVVVPYHNSAGVTGWSIAVVLLRFIR